MGGDDEVRLGVLVDEAGGGLQVLEAQVLALQAVRDHSACSSLQHWKTKILTLKVPDPHVFGPPGPGSGSISQRYGSGSFYHSAQICRR